MPGLADFPGTFEYQTNVDAVNNSSATATLAKFVSGEAVVVTGAYWVPDGQVVADATTYHVLTVLNVGSDGTGTTTVASRTWSTGATAATFVPSTITNASTAANLNVAANDVLQLRLTAPVAVTVPAGSFRLTYQYR